MKHVLVADCNDSFVYNLVQILRESGLCSYEVIKIDAIPLEDLSRFSHVLLSPGPGLPSEFPHLFPLIKNVCSTHSVLGVCLGLQAIGEFFGCRLMQLAHPDHGHVTQLLMVEPDNLLFRGIPNGCNIGHYHSWVIDPKTVSEEIRITAWDNEQRVMAIRHNSLPILGVQFHPESIMTEWGNRMVENWLKET